MSHNSNFHLSGDFSSTPGDFSFDPTSYPTDPQYLSDFSNIHSNSSPTTGSNNVSVNEYFHIQYPEIKKSNLLVSQFAVEVTKD